MLDNNIKIWIYFFDINYSHSACMSIPTRVIFRFLKGVFMIWPKWYRFFLVILSMLTYWELQIDWFFLERWICLSTKRNQSQKASGEKKTRTKTILDNLSQKVTISTWISMFYFHFCLFLFKIMIYFFSDLSLGDWKVTVYNLFVLTHYVVNEYCDKPSWR